MYTKQKVVLINGKNRLPFIIVLLHAVAHDFVLSLFFFFILTVGTLRDLVVYMNKDETRNVCYQNDSGNMQRRFVKQVHAQIIVR